MNGEEASELLGTHVELTDSGAFMIWQGGVEDPPVGAVTILMSKDGALWLANTINEMLDEA